MPRIWRPAAVTAAGALLWLPTVDTPVVADPQPSALAARRALQVEPPPTPTVAAASAPATAPRVAFARLLDRRIVNPRIGRDFAMIVMEAKTGAVVYSHRPNEPQHAASNTKVITAVSVLANMSAKTRFRTRVLAAERPNSVILQGAGDALLSRGAVQWLASRSSRKLDKSRLVTVHVDGDLFGPITRGPGWTAGYDNYRLAPPQALAMFNDYSKHPSVNAANAFAARLRSLGFRARVRGNENAVPGAKLLAIDRGHTLAQAIAVMLARSDSNIAEILFRHVAVARKMPATWEGAIAATRATLADLHVDLDGVSIYDGSGLSRKDFLTPTFVSNVIRLARVEQPKRFAAIFRSHAMPIAGRTGTLHTSYGRYDTYPSRCAAGRVQAKTGTLYDTIALSGVAKARGGKNYVFSMMINSRPRAYSELTNRRALDGLAATITGCWR